MFRQRKTKGMCVMKKSNRHCFSLIRLLAVLLAGILLCSSMALAEIKVSINGVEQEKAEQERPNPNREAVPPETGEKHLPEASDIPEQNEKAEEPEAASPEDLSAKATNPAPTFSCVSSITVGKDLTVTINAVRNAVAYHLNVFDPWGDRAYYYYTESPGKYTIDSMFFDPGEYTITVRADYKDGSDQSRNKKVTVTDPNKQRFECDLDISAAREDGDIPQVNDYVKVILRSPGATKFAVRYGRAYYEYRFDVEDDDDNYYWKSYTYDDLMDDYKIIEAVGGEADDSFYLSGETFAPNYEVLIDLLIEVRVYCNGKWSELNTRVFDIDRPFWLDTPYFEVRIDEDIVEGKDVKIEIDRAEHESYYDVLVNGKDWLYCETDEYYIPEELLIPDATNNIEIHSHTTDPGWSGSESWNENFFIRIGAGRPAAPRLTTEKTVYWMDEDIIFTAESSEAEKIRFRYQSYENGAWSELSSRMIREPEDGQAWLTLSWTVPDNTTKLRVFASALMNEIWSEEAAVTVEIKERPGWLGDIFILPKGLTEIEDYAFANIRTKIIAIPEWVTKIGKGAFSGNNRLIGVEIRAKDIEIGDNAFEGCPNVYFYVIPGSDAVDYLNKHNLPYELDYSLLEN